MFDVVTIGSSLVDIFVQSRDFALRQEDQKIYLCQLYGDKIEVDHFEACIGGGGSNTAIGFARLGFRTAVMSELGTDTWSEIITRALREEQVDTSLLIGEKKEQTGGSVILISPEGGRTVMVYRGAASQLDPNDIADHALAQASWVHISSIAGQLTTLQKIFTTLTQHRIRFSWNPGKAEIRLLVSGELHLEGLRCALLLVNREEWDMLQPVQAKLQQVAAQVIVTHGREGGVVYGHGAEIQRYEVEPAQPVDETGAGDSFAVGYIAGLLLGKDVSECLSMAKHNSASVVQSIGATKGLLTRDQLV